MIRNDRGFTLIELLVAVVILAVALTPLLGSFVQARAVSGESWDDVVAVSLAQGKMEQLKRMPFSALGDEGPTEFAQPYASFTYAVRIDDVAPGLVEITLVVSASDPAGADSCILRAWRARR